jgi:hypothetical protein
MVHKLAANYEVKIMCRVIRITTALFDSATKDSLQRLIVGFVAPEYRLEQAEKPFTPSTRGISSISFVQVAIYARSRCMASASETAPFL